MQPETQWQPNAPNQQGENGAPSGFPLPTQPVQHQQPAQNSHHQPAQPHVSAFQPDPPHQQNHTQAHPGDFNSNPIKSFGIGLGQALFKNPVSIVGVGLMLYLLFFIGYIGIFISVALISLAPAIFLPVTIIGAGVILWLCVMYYARMLTILVKSSSTEQFTLSDAKPHSSSKIVVRLLLGNILYGLIVLGGLILLIVPGIIFAARFSLMPYLIVNENLGAVAGLKRSRRLTKGNTWNMLGAMLTDGILSSNGLVLAAGFAATANRYNELADFEAKGQTNRTTHWLNYLIVLLPVFLITLFIVVMIVVSTIPGVKNRAELTNSSTTPSSQTTTQTPSNTNDDLEENANTIADDFYCYGDAIGSEKLANQNSDKCVSEDECRKIDECNQIYFSFSN